MNKNYTIQFGRIGNCASFGKCAGNLQISKNPAPPASTYAFNFRTNKFILTFLFARLLIIREFAIFAK